MDITTVLISEFPCLWSSCFLEHKNSAEIIIKYKKHPEGVCDGAFFHTFFLSLFFGKSQRPTLPSFPILTKPALCKGPCASEVIEVLIEVCIASVSLGLCDHARLNFCNLPLQSFWTNLKKGLRKGRQSKAPS